MSSANFTFSIYKIQETWIISETLRTLVHVIVFLRWHAMLARRKDIESFGGTGLEPEYYFREGRRKEL